MRSSLLWLTLAAALSTAQAQTPASLQGTWQLTNVQGPGRGRVSPGTGYLVLSEGTVRGRFGCGGYAGSIEAADHGLKLRVRPLAPATDDRCPFAVPVSVLDGLNGAERYVLSGDARTLVLFSKTTRLTFVRPGQVIPAAPR